MPNVRKHSECLDIFTNSEFSQRIQLSVEVQFHFLVVTEEMILCNVTFQFSLGVVHLFQYLYTEIGLITVNLPALLHCLIRHNDLLGTFGKSVVPRFCIQWHIILNWPLTEKLLCKANCNFMIEKCLQLKLLEQWMKPLIYLPNRLL